MPKWEYEERRTLARFLCIVSPILNFLHSHDDCFAALLKLFCHSALAAAHSASAPYHSVTVAARCPAYDRFTVLWLSFLSLQFFGLNVFTPLLRRLPPLGAEPVRRRH